MVLYEGEWVRDGNAFYFEGSKGKGIEIPKTISYKELLGVVHHILKLDPTNCFLSMKYVFNANIQLTDDGDVKFFIGLNCTNGKLSVPLCITVEKRIDNHNQKSICNSYSECHMSFEIDKELNGDSMLMHKSRHIHCDSIETLTIDGENGPRFQNESLEGYKIHHWNMNETAINEEDYRMNTNPTNDKQVTQIGSFRTGSAQSAEILTMIDTNDGFIHDNPTIIKYVANERQNMRQQPIVSGISDDHLEEHQIYSKQKHPGTITDCDNQFKYFFMLIGASLAGFHTSIRHVVAVDGTFLKAKYLGTLFITACKDGNNQIYPLAFGIGDLENDASWEWFLQKLHDALGHIDDLFVILDRHGSIEKAVHKVFPHARHGVCTYHVGQNLKTKFKNPAIHKLFHDAAHAYRVLEFNFIFGQLEMIDPRAARYLMDIGVDRWARSYSTGKRYNIMMIGIVESLNAVLKNARDLPILQLVEELRNLLQKWFDSSTTSNVNVN
ncbi:hypothetical protein CK203_080949 [Vitis vinifera]|uniref:MULE transposase domain-containing protein n=1 Tax=Vitis vinifera TaxID=29760 RepID=A0A438EMV9_VITVI|nr:hypothetical protein CK203_080949 [Vitis vinifera]